jgi:tripartite-type tricarboxylate transporter receptor subunit TctC
MADVATGRVHIVIEGYSGLAGSLTSGTIKGIAVSSPERLADFKDLPAVAETLPGFVAGGWNVLLAPIGTPEAIVKKAGADLNKALDDETLKTKFASLGAYLRPMTPAQVIAFAQEQQKTWQPVAEKVASEMAQPPK